MSCRWCASQDQMVFGTEINIHFPGRKGLDKPAVLAWPMLVVCLHCGFTEFTLAETDVRLLVAGVAEAAAS